MDKIKSALARFVVISRSSSMNEFDRAIREEIADISEDYELKNFSFTDIVNKDIFGDFSHHEIKWVLILELKEGK